MTEKDETVKPEAPPARIEDKGGMRQAIRQRARRIFAELRDGAAEIATAEQVAPIALTPVDATGADRLRRVWGFALAVGVPTSIVPFAFTFLRASIPLGLVGKVIDA